MMPRRTVRRVILPQRLSLGHRLRRGTGDPLCPAHCAISYVDGHGGWAASTSRAVRSIVAALHPTIQALDGPPGHRRGERL